MMNLTKQEMLDELEFYLSVEEMLIIKDDILKIEKKLLDVIENNKQEVYADYLIANGLNDYILIDTPDGWNSIEDYYIKYRDCIKLILDNGLELECSIDHKIETSEGWKLADDIFEEDLILTKNGWIKLNRKEVLPNQKVYDFEVNHPNHRYWSNYISSHNTSKTFMDCYYAIEALRNHKFEKIIFTKPIQEAGEKIGFLPGSIADKIDPHYESYRTNLLKLIDEETLSKLIEKKIIEFKPLTYMRGVNLDNSIICLDEAQNCDWKQLIMFTTRMGSDSKMIISGDTSQYDINLNMTALVGFINMIEDINGVGLFKFDSSDIMRHPILKEIVDRYEQLKYSGQLNEEKYR